MKYANCIRKHTNRLDSIRTARTLSARLGSTYGLAEANSSSCRFSFLGTISRFFLLCLQLLSCEWEFSWYLRSINFSLELILISGLGFDNTAPGLSLWFCFAPNGNRRLMLLRLLIETEKSLRNGTGHVRRVSCDDEVFYVTSVVLIYRRGSSGSYYSPAPLRIRGSQSTAHAMYGCPHHSPARDNEISRWRTSLTFRSGSRVHYFQLFFPRHRVIFFRWCDPFNGLWRSQTAKLV